MARQMPVVVVPGGERQVDRHRHGPSAYGGGRPLPLGRRRFQYIFFETAKKRKSRSEFRCGFLFEEPGGFKGGSPVSSSSVRPSVRVPKTRILCQEPIRVGRLRRGLHVGAQRPHRHPGPTPSPTATSSWRRKTTNTWWAPWHEVEGLNGAPIGLNGPSIGFKS